MRLLNRLAAFAALISLCATPALPQGTDVAFGGQSHDSSQPVEITSDALELDQENSTATFVGNVLVGQGSLKMQADRILVSYTSDGARQISSMLATGNVLLTNGAESAEAGKAIYDVATGNIDMEGDVLLTQGGNALSGQKLVINLESGSARMEGRVKTIFQPGASE
ncbi:lipopolysaccharide transport periplasmic protein LptA [Halovulum sp. GXIMD14793]